MGIPPLYFVGLISDLFLKPFQYHTVLSPFCQIPAASSLPKSQPSSASSIENTWSTPPKALILRLNTRSDKKRVRTREKPCPDPEAF